MNWLLYLLFWDIIDYNMFIKFCSNSTTQFIADKF